jgi:hypothetical protein
MPKRPSRARPPRSRRYSYTPALIADGRRRYEHTAETVTAIAADFGVNKSTLTRMARREGWVRYVAPPRDLPGAAKLAAAAEALIQIPFIPAQAGIQDHERDAGGPSPGSPLARGRADDVAPQDTVFEIRRLKIQGRRRGSYHAARGPR